jgi:hypothetical protein
MQVSILGYYANVDTQKLFDGILWVCLVTFWKELLLIVEIVTLIDVVQCARRLPHFLWKWHKKITTLGIRA